MSATNDAGKLLLTPKGEYSGSTTYEVMDAVYYITSTVKGVYVAKGTTTGNLPTDTTKWKLLIDLGDFITDASLATSSTVGLVKPDGITDEVDALGILTALGVVIKAEVNTGATAYSATWLKVGTTTLTPSTKQMYRVTENSVECLYYWNGTNYAKIPAGHTIVNASGTAMATRGKLKFTGATITDDSTNDQTVVAITGGGADSGMVEDLVKDTVGFTGKNRAYSQTNNAVIASIESGKTYSVSWTGSATITLKKDSASGTEITSGSTSPLTFTADADYDLYFGSSADVTQIMVCDSALDGEYEEYHESVKSVFEDVADDIDGINELNNTKVSSGIMTVNPDKTITLDGTSSSYINIILIEDLTPFKNRKMVFSGGHTGDTWNTANLVLYHNPTNNMVYQNGIPMQADENGIVVDFGGTFEANGNPISLEEISLRITANKNVSLNKTFSPMLYDEKYGIGLPYRPFNQQSIQHQINDITGVTGVRNLLPNEATTQTVNGVTYTVNDDKSITISGTTTNTSTDGLDINIKRNVGLIVKPGRYYASVGVPIPDHASFIINVYKNNVYYKTVVRLDSGEKEVEFEVPSDATGMSVYTLVDQAANVSIPTTTIYPMIRLASDPSDEYVPYVMTNRELTDGLTAIAGALVDKGELDSTNDLNNIDAQGIYHMKSKPTNSPTQWSPLIVYRRNAADIRQVIYGNDDNIYIRQKGGNPSTWTSWIKFTGTVVS